MKQVCALTEVTIYSPLTPAISAPATHAILFHGWWAPLLSTQLDTIDTAASLLTGFGPVSTIHATILIARA